ncbi:serine hydrolase [Streptomyces sp. A7024]|uniref:Serine hydrolase n=1 Tax=Streptomyces coryli TaxID=1128680 RepID=A0A6G4TUT8_9ACTN|nr:serine hydrolase domain-containing protein [Streptomyces coryli]NGN62868.1 serine hydrolase [Streptomyces coryli]
MAEGLTRRQLGAAFGGAVVVAALGSGTAGAVENTEAGSGGTLRRGSARQAGLLQEWLDKLVEDARTFLGPSPKYPWYAGAVMLAGRGRTVALEKAIGKAVRYQRYDEATDTGIEFPPDKQIDMALDTVFDLASVSKLFTSLLAVQQIERGKVELEAAVASYLPEFGAAGKEAVTIRQLLTHTSGFTSWIPLYAEPTWEAKLQRLWNQPLASPPGTKYLYSDLNLISLQLVLEKVTGKKLDVLLHDEITGPLGMTRTRFTPPAHWQPKIAATEDARKPWSGLDRGLVWGEVHDENAFSFDGVAGHAGVFSCAWDLAVLARTLLNGGSYGRKRILKQESVDLMFTDFNTDFPGDEHGLGFELYQHWYMGAMATPGTAGHTGFTGTSLVLDPSTDSFLVLLGNSVHPVRSWRSGSAPRVATANDLARAVPVRPLSGEKAWFSGMASQTEATLTLPALAVPGPATQLRFGLWWDTEPAADAVSLEASADDGATWTTVPFTTQARGQDPKAHPDGAVDGWSGRVWHRAAAPLTDWHGKSVRLRWRYVTDLRYVGRGVYVDAVRVTAGDDILFDDSRRGDASRIEAKGWTASAD